MTPRLSLVACTKCTVLSALGHLGKQPWRQEVGEAGDLDLICDVALQQVDYQAKVTPNTHQLQENSNERSPQTI